METAEKLRVLRENLVKQRLAGYLQPVHDEYMSEYPPDCNRRVEWLCGFSGSAGSVAVLGKKAALFTDGRYTLQAKNETDDALFEHYNSGTHAPEEWLAEQLAAGERLGYDPRLFTRNAVKRLEAALAKKGAKLAACDNLVDAIWADRPAAPASAVVIHPMQYAGRSSADKRRDVAAEVKAAGADAALLTAPDAICWLLNIRGADVANTPLVLATAMIDANAHVVLFIAPSRCDAKVRAHLGEEVEIRDPAAMHTALVALGNEKRRVLCDPQSVPVWFTQTINDADGMIIHNADPCLLLKAVKNPVQLQGMRAAHIRDGVALTKALYWIDQETLHRKVSEMEVCDCLLALRTQQKDFQEPSFPTISGSGPNGAIVHYRVSPESNRTLGPGELFLLDSGGQYPDGTTDVTRTIPIGEPTGEHKDRFTRVLKGHIAVACALFPEGTSGTQLDALARQYLWQAELDYDHGTGHGVGHFLGVHEGPQRISKRGGDVALKPGMIVSNEPGYYKTGEFGIRIENLVTVVEKPHAEHGRKWLGFETITCVPLDTRLVVASMLTATEKEWLNAYHAWVLASLSDALDYAEREWLKHRCEPIL